MKRTVLAWLALAAAAGCGKSDPSAGPAPGAALAPLAPVPEEKHLADVRQLTAGGENAEAYWSFDGRQLILQARTGDSSCDRIYRMDIAPALAPPAGERRALPQIPVSSGKGATTCSYFLPGDKKVIYASTHLGGDACPPKPDPSQGYVWALYDTYDIFKANPDGTGVERLTDVKGYDAEATVCAKDGSIVFTSTRDGDIDLYRMDADGKNVKRLTSAPGYDGGAFFNADCSKIVWRASRPRPGKELDDFKRLLGQGLVRPSKLELYVANADGSEATQITYLNAASFAPFWHPSQRRILFSSNRGDPKGREFDLWAVNVDGTALERITYAPGFDGFPMFSPDGKLLAFASNRATAPGKHDTNVFLARWVDEPQAPAEPSAPDRVMKDIAWLADPAREGRGIGQKGLADAGAYVEARFKELGLAPAGSEPASFRQPFPVVTQLKQEEGTSVAVDGKALAPDDYVVMGYSPPKAEVSGDMVDVGYGIAAKDLGVDDYGKLDVKGKVVVVRRFVPEGEPFTSAQNQRRHGDIRFKAWNARFRGAAALVVVDDPLPPRPAPPGSAAASASASAAAPPPGAPASAAASAPSPHGAHGEGKEWTQPAEAKLPRQQPEGHGDSGLPVVVVKRSVGHAILERLKKKERVSAKIAVALTPVSSDAFNVVGRLVAEPKEGTKLPGAVVIGAHYDHLGKGGRHSLAPMSEEPHVGADDNASGAAVLLEVARALAARRGELRRDVIFAAFSGEESGVLGSAHFVRAAGAKPPAQLKDVVAMLNMDMVGRLRENRLQVLGTETAAEWNDLVQTACSASRVECAGSGDGYGPSDHTSFYSAGVPVLHFFSGTHSDYHKPSDTPDKINAAGAAQVGEICSSLALQLGQREAPLTLKTGASTPGEKGDVRSFNASLGTIPDYGGPGPGKKGVLLAGVRPGGGADKAGMKKGDVLIRLGSSDLGGVEDLMFVLNSSHPGETVPAVVLRDGKEVKLEVTFQEGQRPK